MTLGPLKGDFASFPEDWSSTDAVTLVFDVVLTPTDGGTHMLLEHTVNINSTNNGIFMLSESEFGVSNVLEFCSKTAAGYDIATCPRPSVGATHAVAWVIDRTKAAPCHSIFIDGVKQPVTAQSGYSTTQGAVNFLNDSLYVMARAGDQIPATGAISHPPQVYLRALSDAEAVAASAPRTYADVVKDDGPVGYYRLTEGAGTTLADAMGGAAASINGSFTMGLPGPVSRGLAIDNGNNAGHVVLPPLNIYSVEMWVNRSSAYTAAGTWQYLLDSRTAHAAGYVTAAGSGGDWPTMYVNGVNVGAPGTLTSIPVGQWAHVVLVAGGVATADPARVFARYTDSERFPGQLAELAVYDYALSATQVQAHYAAASVAPPDTAPNTPTGLTLTPNPAPAGTAVTAAWTYSDPDGDPQQKFQVQTRQTSPATPPWESAVLAYNPVIYHRLDEPAGATAEVAEAGTNGTYSSSAVLGAAPSRVPGATAMSNGYLTVPAWTQPQQVTILGWFRADAADMDTNTSYRSLWGFGGNDWDCRFESPTSVTCHMYDAAGDWPSVPNASWTTPVNDGLWHLFTVVWDGVKGTWAIYIDAAQVGGTGSFTPGSLPRTHTGNYTIGAAGGGRTWIGDEAEFAVLPQALTQAQVQSLFNVATQPANPAFVPQTEVVSSAPSASLTGFAVGTHEVEVRTADAVAGYGGWSAAATLTVIDSVPATAAPGSASTSAGFAAPAARTGSSARPGALATVAAVAAVQPVGGAFQPPPADGALWSSVEAFGSWAAVDATGSWDALSDLTAHPGAVGTAAAVHAVAVSTGARGAPGTLATSGAVQTVPPTTSATPNPRWAGTASAFGAAAVSTGARLTPPTLATTGAVKAAALVLTAGARPAVKATVATVGAARLSTLEVAVTHATASAVAAPALTSRAVPATFATAPAFPVPSAQTTALVVGVKHATYASVVAPVLSAGSTPDPAPHATVAAFGVAPRVVAVANYAAPRLATASAFPPPGVSAAAGARSATVATVSAVSVAEVSAGSRSTPGALGTHAVAGAVSVSSGWTAYAATLPTTWAAYAPGSSSRASPLALGTAAAFGAPQVAVGSRSAPATAATVVGVPSVGLSTASRVLAGVGVTAVAFPGASASASSVPAPSVCGTVAGFPGPLLSAGAQPTAVGLSTSSTVGAARLSTGAEPTPATLGTAAAVPAVALSVEVRLAVPAVATAAAFPAAVLHAGATPLPAGVASVSVFSGAALSAGVRLAVATLGTAAGVVPAWLYSAARPISLPTAAGFGAVVLAATEHPATHATAAALASATPAAGSCPTPGAWGTQTSVSGVAASAGAAPLPGTVPTSTAFGSPSLAGTATTTTLTTASGVGGVQLQTDVRVAAATLASTASAPVPNLALGQVAAPAVLGTSIAFPLASQGGDAKVSVLPIGTTSSVRAPEIAASARAAAPALATAAVVRAVNTSTEVEFASRTLNTAAKVEAAGLGATHPAGTVATRAAFGVTAVAATSRPTPQGLVTYSAFPPGVELFTDAWLALPEFGTAAGFPPAEARLTGRSEPSTHATGAGFGAPQVTVTAAVTAGGVSTVAVVSVPVLSTVANLSVQALATVSEVGVVDVVIYRPPLIVLEAGAHAAVELAAAYAAAVAVDAAVAAAVEGRAAVPGPVVRDAAVPGPLSVRGGSAVPVPSI